MTASHSLNKQLGYFILVGITAALTHFSIVALLDLHPLISNVIAFVIAFNISFLGHKYLTFSAPNQEKKLKLPYFFMVAGSALILNETLYFLLLHYTNLHYLVALVLVLGTVAVYTFLLSRFWACR